MTVDSYVAIGRKGSKWEGEEGREGGRKGGREGGEERRNRVGQRRDGVGCLMSKRMLPQEPFFVQRSASSEASCMHVCL